MFDRIWVLVHVLHMSVNLWCPAALAAARSRISDLMPFQVALPGKACVQTRSLVSPVPFFNNVTLSKLWNHSQLVFTFLK